MRTLNESLSAPPPGRRVPWKKILGVAVVTLVVLELSVELASHWDDHVLERRASAPGYRAPEKAADFDLWDRLAYGTLEYGSPKRAREQAGARSEPHPYLGYALIPNYRTPPGATQQVSHNSLGFRGKETTWEKPAGVYRIVTTGGSSVYGQSESGDAAVWSQKLEEMVQAQRPGFRVEVVNLRTLVPLDEACVLAAARTSPLLVTLEDHLSTGGPHSIVAELALRHRVAPRTLPIGLATWFAPALLRDVLEVERMSGAALAERIASALEEEA